MIEIILSRRDINAPQLIDELKTYLGDDYRGFRVDGAGLHVYLRSTALPAVRILAEQAVINHDPSVRTEAQQRRDERDQHPFFTMTEAQIADYLAGLSELERWRAVVKFVIWTRDTIREN